MFGVSRACRGQVTHVPTGDKVTGNWRRLHDGERYDLYSSMADIIRMMMSGTCVMYVGQGRCIQGLVRRLMKETSLKT